MSRKIVIIGGVAGGMSAAARARRLDESASITVLEAGGFVSFANCGLPYHIAGRIADERKLLVTTAERVKARFNIDVHVHTRATRIDRVRKRVEAEGPGGVRAFDYDVLVIATGASPVVPQVDHVRAKNVCTLRSMEDTRSLKALLEASRPRRAVIVGAGFIGLEMTEALVDRGMSVTLIEKNDRVLPPLDGDMAQLVEAELRKHNVTVVTGTGLRALHGSDEHVTAVETDDGRRFDAELVLLSIGVRPNVQLAKEAGLAVGPAGGIAVDGWQRTSDPTILAVGDATEVRLGVTGTSGRVPLGGPANRQGRVAGTVAVLGKYPGQPCERPAAGAVMGTAIVKVFSLAAGLTGLTEKAAQAAGFDHDVALVTASHHASYYPDAFPLRLKLVYDRTTTRILGAQAAGRDGVDKRLDVVATLLHFGGTVADLGRLDLAYAPQFGSAKDPLHMAAFVAENQLAGVTRAISRVPEGALLVDVRTPEEFAEGHLPGAVNHPLETLRQTASSLPKDRPLVTYCKVGQRGYVAERLLRQLGFNEVANLRGGYWVAAGLPVS